MLPVHVQMWSIHWADLRGRGLPVHVYTPVSCLYPYSTSFNLSDNLLYSPHQYSPHPSPASTRRLKERSYRRTVTTALLESLCLCFSTHQALTDLHLQTQKSRLGEQWEQTEGPVLSAISGNESWKLSHRVTESPLMSSEGPRTSLLPVCSETLRWQGAG